MFLKRKEISIKRMAQKYIKDDIVMYDNKVMAIKEPRDGNHFDLYCHKEGLVYFFVDVDEIKPVRITQEFLEKNLWSREDVVFGVSPDFKKIIDNPARKKGYITCLSVYPFFDNDGFSFFYNNQKLAIIHYIHELQHILYGLKINSEMEV